MKRLRRITVARIMSWSPCPGWTRERVQAAFGGRRSLTPLEILALGDVPPTDRLWVILREEIIPSRELRLIACWFAERALRSERATGREPDKRSWAAVAVSRRYADGRATAEELSAAEAAAGVAAWDASAAAWAAGVAAWAAGVAARDAAEAASAAAWAAAGVAAWAATYQKTIAHVRRVLRRLEVS